MKKVKTILLSGVLTLGVFSMVAYTSCSKKDKCDSITCKNGGTCSDGVCKCPVGFEGVNCEISSAGKFAGLWAATDNCNISDRTGSDLKYQITISQSNTDPLKVDVRGIASTDYSFSATANGKVLTIEEQEAADGRTYSGTITYQNDSTLALKFNIESGGNYVEICQSVLNKK